VALVGFGDNLLVAEGAQTVCSGDCQLVPVVEVVAGVPLAVGHVVQL